MTRPPSVHTTSGNQGVAKPSPPLFAERIPQQRNQPIGNRKHRPHQKSDGEAPPQGRAHDHRRRQDCFPRADRVRPSLRHAHRAFHREHMDGCCSLCPPRISLRSAICSIRLRMILAACTPNAKKRRTTALEFRNRQCFEGRRREYRCDTRRDACRHLPRKTRRATLCARSQPGMLCASASKELRIHEVLDDANSVPPSASRPRFAAKSFRMPGSIVIFIRHTRLRLFH